MIGVGLVGCGALGARRAAIAATAPRSRVVAVVDVDAERAARVARETGAAVAATVEELAADAAIDAVVVSTTNDALVPSALTSIRAGKHVFCEKPVARGTAELAVLAHASDPSSTVVVGFTLRHHPGLRRAKELLDEGAIGRVLNLSCSYGHGGRVGYSSEWRMDRAIAGGGELLDQGIHCLDLFRWLCGDFDSVVGFTARSFWSSRIEPADVEDGAMALLRRADGVIASLHVSLTFWQNRFALDIHGDQGSIAVRGLGGSYGGEQLTLARRKLLGSPPVTSLESFDGTRAMSAEWEAFERSVLEEQPATATLEDARAALALVEAIYRAEDSRYVTDVRATGVVR